jgi:hypothetical protein
LGVSQRKLRGRQIEFSEKKVQIFRQRFHVDDQMRSGQVRTDRTFLPVGRPVVGESVVAESVDDV